MRNRPRYTVYILSPSFPTADPYLFSNSWILVRLRFLPTERINNFTEYCKLPLNFQKGSSLLLGLGCLKRIGVYITKMLSFFHTRFLYARIAKT